MSVISKKSVDVLIIGAGAAGLAAAPEISAAGLSVVILEARDRIGGRIYTYRDNSIQIPIELGAEFIHGKPPEILDLVESSGLLLCDVTGRHWFLSAGVLTKSDKFWEKLENLMDQMKQVGPRDSSFQEFVDSLPDDEETQEAKSIALRYVRGFHAAKTERISVRGLVRTNEASDRIEGDKQFRILSGYDHLVERLARKASEQGTLIHLNRVVKEVSWSRNHVEVIVDKSDDEAERFIASRVLVTLPLGVLQAAAENLGAVRFVPALPQEKRDAITRLEVGQVLKITLRFRKRFWEDLELPHDGSHERLSDLGFIHSSDSAFPTWWTLLPVRSPIIVGWVGGPDAENVLSRAKQFILGQATDSLATILGVSENHIRDLLQDSYMHNWHSDPYARGAYSYVPVNCLDAQATISRSVQDTLFFAGEATSLEGHIGTVHGAMASGKRAAREIVETWN